MDFIRKKFNVPAKRGGIIEYNGQRGVIVGAAGYLLKIRLNGQENLMTVNPSELKYF